jgi:tetratricopeptide (TPR) repeat protein
MPLRSLALPVGLLALGVAFASIARASAELGRGDALWERRAEGQVDAKAKPEPIRAAVDAYRAALRADPDGLEAHWKLQRALWFLAHYATTDTAEAQRLYEEAIATGEDSLRVLALRTGDRDALDALSPEALREKLSAADRRDAAHFYFWHAVNLGAWARGAGLLDAVRAGVANRMHAATLCSIALDPDVEQGGALRLLSRLHAELPRVPLLSGWVDHDRALPLAEQVAADYPHHPGNAFLLGLTLLEKVPGRRDEALTLLERTATLEPRADHLVEDVSIRIEAREKLDATDVAPAS